MHFPVMSTLQGTYIRIEQTSEAIRQTYNTCRAGGVRTGIENRWIKHAHIIIIIWLLKYAAVRKCFHKHNHKNNNDTQSANRQRLLY